MDSDTESPDFDWIYDKEKLVKIYKGLEKEPQSVINITNIYIDTNKNIVNVEKTNIPTTPPNSPTDNYTIIPYNIIVNYISSCKNNDGKTYKSPIILLYLINIIHEQISQFNSETDFTYSSYSFLNQIYTYDNIRIPNSLFMFHAINTIYVIQHEIDVDPIYYIYPPPKLQIVDEFAKSSSAKPRKTKKVSFNISHSNHPPNHPPAHSQNAKKTRKFYNIKTI